MTITPFRTVSVLLAAVLFVSPARCQTNRPASDPTASASQRGADQAADDSQLPTEATPANPRATRREQAREKVLYSDETESIKPLASKLFRNTLLDQKDIWTSPFHLTRQNAATWAVFGAATGAFVAYDRSLSRKLPNTSDQIAISRDFSNIGAPYTVVPGAAAFYLAGVIWDSPKARETGALSAEALLDTLVVGAVLKVAAGRERPLEGHGNGRFFHGGQSFPSGHAMESFAFASVVAHEYQKSWVVPIGVYSLATLLCASRFTARQHFASDIVAGGVMGWFIGRYVFRTHVDTSIHHRPPSKLSALRPQIAPQLSPQTVGVSLAWGLNTAAR